MSLETLLLQNRGSRDKTKYGESEDEKQLFERHLLTFTASDKGLQFKDLLFSDRKLKVIDLLNQGILQDTVPQLFRLISPYKEMFPHLENHFEQPDVFRMFR
jgi:hypothetical protein